MRNKTKDFIKYKKKIKKSNLFIFNSLIERSILKKDNSPLFKIKSITGKIKAILKISNIADTT
jgi:hypothetical protein